MRRCLISGLAAFLLVSPAFAQSKTVNVTPVDCSGAIATGGTAQTVFGTASGRQGFQIQNLDTTEPLWISITGTAVAGAVGSFALAAGATTTFAGVGSYYSPFGFNTALSVVAATTAHKFSCTRW
jgi:hypothetical protein